MVSTSSYPVPSQTSSTEGRVNVGQAERIASGLGGVLLTIAGLRRGSLPGLLMAALGGALAWRGATGRCPMYERMGIDTAQPESKSLGLDIQETLTINRPRHEVYAYWRELSNLPRFMRHLESVTPQGDGRSHWVARAPKDLTTVEWDAQITQDFKDERLSWCSQPGADIDNAGHVEFEDAPEGRGTVLRARIHYRPPGGGIGRTVTGLFNPVHSQMIKEDLRRFRSVMEAGEAPTTEGQPTGPH